MEFTTAALARLSAMIARRSGMVFEEGRWPFLKNRARAVMARSGFTQLDRWTEELEASGESRQSLYSEFEQALQVHETSFFRYEGHHRALRELVILDRLRRQKSPGQTRVRIWSVACSTGQEPYSVAMSACESLGSAAGRVVEILAVDASTEAVATAARGVYAPAEVVSVPRSLLGKYFVPDGAGYRVAPELQAMIRFFHHDARQGLYFGKFDAVFCCNMLLYFTPAMRRQILSRLAESLQRGGYLFLGHAEGIRPPAEWFEPAPDAAGCVPAGLATPGA